MKVQIGKLIKGAISTVTGDFLTKGIDLVTKYVPDPSQRAAMVAELQALEIQKDEAINKAITQAASDLDRRVEQHEGTVSDLKAIPYIGPIVIFARGMQRIVWGYGTFYIDIKWLFGIGMKFSDRQEIALIAINVLVLGFLFGERAIKNIMPIIARFLDSRAK